MQMNWKVLFAQYSKTQNPLILFYHIKSTVMKKYILIISAMVFINTTLLSQLRLGLKTSYAIDYTSSSYKEHYSFDEGLYYDIGFISNRNCFSYGLGSYSEIGNLFFSADFMFRRCYTQIQLHSITSSRNESINTYEDEYSVFHLPIAAGFRIKDLKVGFGPIFNFMIDSKLALSEMESIEAKGKKLKPGFQFVMGIILKERIHIDFKSELNFTRVLDQYFIHGSPSEIRVAPKLISINVGFFL